jgi:hypothetical protein
MRRRSLLLGLGSLSAAGLGVGTGAFSLGSVDRNADVVVPNEDNAFLAMEPSSGPNGAYATQGSQDQIGLDFTNNGQGSGVNSEGEFYADDVFRIKNQGTQRVYVWARFSGGNQFDNSNFYLYPNGARETELKDNSNSVLTLASGESANIGAYIDTESTSTDTIDNLTMTIKADVDKPSSSGSVGPDGDQTLVVSQNPDQDGYSSIQNAIDDATGTTVLVEPGTYDESVTIDVPGLTLEGANAGVPGMSTRGEESKVTQSMTIAAEGVTIDGLQVDSAVGNGINMFKPLNNVTIKNNVVSNVEVTGFDDPVKKGKDVAANGINISLRKGSTGAKVKNFLIENNKIGPIDISGPGGKENHEVTATGIRFNQKAKNVDNPVIRGNLITDLIADKAGSGDSEARGFTFNVAGSKDATGDNVVRNLVFKYNEISDLESGKTWALGLFENGKDPHPGPKNFKIKRNVFDDLVDTTTGQDPAAIFVGAINDLGNDHIVKYNNILSGGVARYSKGYIDAADNLLTVDNWYGGRNRNDVTVTLGDTGPNLLISQSDAHPDQINQAGPPVN